MLLASLLLAASPSVAVSDPIRIADARFELEWHGTRAEANEAFRVLDAAHAELARFFEGAPREALRVRVFRDEKSRVEAVWSDRAMLPAHNRNAWFSEQTRVSYVARLDGPCATRTNLLYATCLQFHSLVKSKNIDVQRTWHAQGIAHDFARHTWDGRTLRTFTQPRVEPVDMPGRARDALMRVDNDLAKLAAGDYDDPVLMWGIASMCMHGPQRAYRDTFARYALGEKGSKLGTVDFVRMLGDGKRVSEDLHEFLESRRAPFEILGDWSDRGADDLLASPGAGVAYAVLHQGVARLSARVSALPKSGARVGFVLGWTAPNDCCEIEIEAPEALIRITRDGDVVRQTRLAVPGDACRERTIAIERVGGAYVLTIDGARHEGLELPGGRMGLYAGGADVHFRDLSWR